MGKPVGRPPLDEALRVESNKKARRRGERYHSQAARTARWKAKDPVGFAASQATCGARFQASPKGRERSRRYRERNAAALKSRNTAKLVDMRALRDTMKSIPCADCGGRFDPVCMDFDHRAEEVKLYDVSWMFNRKLSIALIEVEIAKCDIVCSNCHRLRTKHRKIGAALGLT